MTLSERYLRAKRTIITRCLEEQLNPEQRDAVCTVNGPLLVLAGAGSGKTTVLVRRIAFIIRYGNAFYTDALPDGVDEEIVSALEDIAANMPAEDLSEVMPEFITNPCPPYAVLAITFTNKAAKEIKERLAATFEDESVSKEIWAGTFHSVCVRILRRYGDRLGYREGFSIYDTDEQKRLISDVMKGLNIDEKLLPIKAVASSISGAKNRLISPEGYAAGKDFRQQKIKEIYAEYQKRLLVNNALDFDDIIMQTVRLLETDEEARSYYQNKFRFVCVDEYQDTNFAQFRLTELLSGKYRNIMVVGDDDQSIYKFRGATIENILNFDKSYPDAKVIKLERNYRSTGNILAAANAVISHNSERHEKSLWTMAEDGDRLTVRECADQNGEARYIIDKIMEAVAAKKCRYRDVAILYRLNELSRFMESAFAKSGIPYRILGGQRFYDREEIRDMVAYLHILLNPDDSQRLKRIINKPRRKIGPKALEALEGLSYETGKSVYRIMQESDKYTALKSIAPTLLSFTAMVDGIRSSNMPVSQLIGALFERSGYRDMLVAEGEVSKTRIDNVGELVSAAQEYEARTEEASLLGFLEEVALVSDVDKYDEEADAVVMMTVHSAKGLEFPTVFLAGMEDGIFPSLNNKEDPAQLNEERRLAYVAITRAKKHLYVTHSRERVLYGRSTSNKLSMFIREEVPVSLLKKESDPRTDFFSASRASEGDYYRRGFGQRSASPRAASGFGERYGTPTGGQGRQSASHASSYSRPTPKPSAAASPMNAAMRQFKAGARVRHMMFGEGVIVSAKDMGGDLLLEVAFDSGESKKLMASFAISKMTLI